MPQSIRSAAVVGDGPAGTTVATLLARRGVDVALFARGRPTGMVVGESLIPAVIPILRELGIEDEVRSYSVYKPGATFVLRGGGTFSVDFAEFAGSMPGYAYNTPRDRFDASLLGACRGSGARIIDAPARFERVPGTADGIRLAGEAAATAAELFAGEPDIVIDASGRNRSVARLLDLPTVPGDRRDTALFAHCEGIPLASEGNIHMDHLGHGWCWRIPLPGRVSLGLVVNPEALADFGPEAEAQFDGLLAADPHLKELCRGARRVSPVLRYNNYQLTTMRGTGPGWALVGDAFGFIDPIFSSGLLLAMQGARNLADAVVDGSPRAFAAYEAEQLRQFAAWRHLVDYYYDGRLFDVVALGQPDDPNWIGRLVNPHIASRVTRLLTGEATTNRYARWLLDFLIQHALPTDRDSEMRIR